jgi:hypothetical protein
MRISSHRWRAAQEGADRGSRSLWESIICSSRWRVMWRMQFAGRQDDYAGRRQDVGDWLKK